MLAQAQINPGIAGAASNLRSCEIVANLDPRFGGIAQSVPNMVGALRGSNLWNSDVVAFCAPDEFPSEEMSSCVSRRFPLGRTRLLFDNQLRKDFQAEVDKADLCHVHGIWQEHFYLTVSNARRARKPFVVSAHGMLSPWALGVKSLKKKVYSALFERRNLLSAACLRALTTAEADDYRRFGLTNRIEVIPNGVTIPSELCPQVFYNRFPELRDKFLVLFMSRLHPKKGADLLCRAWARVAPRFKDAHLLIAGPDFDGTRSSLEHLVKSLDISKSVSLPGILNDQMKWSALAAARCFVLASHSEGLSIAILEALGAGLPVIATEQCNFPEIESFGCGFLIQPEVGSLEMALLQILSSPESDLRSMGARGRQRINSKYAWPSVATSIVDLYRSLIR